LGNTQDVPISNPSCSDDNPAGYSICIEAHDQARMPDTQLLRDIDDTLTGFEEDETDDGGLREFGQCSLTEEEDDGDDDEGIPPPVPRKDTAADDSDYLHLPASQIAHLEVLSTPQLLPTTSLPAYLTSLVNLAYFIHLQSSPSPSSSFRPRRVLIHCGDGYTETSTLALTYIMLSRRVPLAEAYLVLQEECGRSFFVYQNDVEVLLDKVERRVQAFLRREDERKGKSGGSEMERSDSGFSEGGGDKRERGSGGGDTREQGKMQLTTPERFPWFFGETWEGCFPSRILSFLYLGNLAHASNALMLKELGITHVVSMGESAMSPPRQPPFSLSSINSSNSRWNLPTNSLWLEECLGNIAVLDIVDIADDGIAGIRRTFDECLDFIEDARVTGGKVLVHCRVGVSRSATVVIAYLMRELELDLKSAYLLTRSRRLNILIQPNLPFAATLHAYEAELILAREAELQARKEGRSDRTDEFLCTEDRVEELGQAGLKWSNRLDWGFLAGEVARLNERFLA
ncbi:phosphatases II, partial [Meredithblackwellia eburnea MCA 4105]